MSISHLIEQNAQQDHSKPAWKPEYPAVGYLIATVKDDRTEIVEVMAWDEEYPDMPNRDLLKYPNHYAVQLCKSTHRPFRYHRFFIGTILANGKFVFSVAPRVDDWKSGSPKVDSGSWDALHKLLEAAESWQGGDASFQTDGYVERSSGPPQTSGFRKTGKTERARARGKAKPKSD